MNARPNQSAICLHCGESFDLADYHYMVRDEIWLLAGMQQYKAGVIHLWCISERLGRQLRVSDFTDAPMARLVVWAIQNVDAVR